MKDFIKEIFEIFEPDPWPMLKKSIGELSNPPDKYKGITILNNTPMDFVTIVKALVLTKSGADVTLTISDDLPRDEKAIQYLKENNINYLMPHELKGRKFDIVLDCNAGMQGIVTATKGIAELTGSGKYKYNHVKVPVVNVDDSETKKLETFYGTADGFIRGFLQETRLDEKDIMDKIFIVYGYGKVGKGIVYGLNLLNAKVIIVDVDEDILENANKDTQIQMAINGNNAEAVKKAFKEAFCIVTTTGREGVVSKYFNRSDISKSTYLVNMGVEDEFGDKFLSEDVLYSKKPINFVLKRPTLSKFLDPIFYAHNKVVDILLDDQYSLELKNGLNPFPHNLDMRILEDWKKLHSGILIE